MATFRLAVLATACSGVLLGFAGCGDDSETPPGTGGATSATTTAAASSSSTGSGTCTPGEEVDCYTGPDGTEGVGTCAAGKALCDANGVPGACVGEVLPAVDYCRTPADEDCDGEAAACTGDHIWSKRFGDASQQNGKGVSVDPDGNILMFGSFFGTLDLGGPPLTEPGGFVAKLDADGNHQWSTSFPGRFVPPDIKAITTDRFDNVFLIGNFGNAADFGGGTLTPAGSQDVFLVKLDPQGNHLWSQRFGDAEFQLGWGVIADADGSVIISGEHNGSIDFGGGPLTSGVGQSNVFLAKLEADGTHAWSRTFGDGSVQYAREVAVDADDNVILTGYFFGSIDFGGGALTSMGAADVYVAKFDRSGDFLWSEKFGSPSGDGSYGVATDAEGNIAIVGSSGGAIDFGGGPLENAGEDDLFVAKLDPDGNHIWSRTFGDAADQYGLDVAADAQGCVMVGGIFRGTLDLGGTPLVNAGDDDTFVAKLGLDGEHLWSRAFGDAERQFGYGVAADPDGNVVVTGDLRLTIDFGGGPLTGAGDYDVFLAKYAP